jgi:hypothetical protein
MFNARQEVPLNQIVRIKNQNFRGREHEIIRSSSFLR